MIYLYVCTYTRSLKFTEEMVTSAIICYWFSCIAFFISVGGLLHSNAITENYIHQSFYIFSVISAQKCLKLTDSSRASCSRRAVVKVP